MPLKSIERRSFSQLNEHKKITSGTREWADFNVNCVLGCHNNCRYCYAKLMAKRFRRATDQTWSLMKVRENVLKGKFRKFPGRVMFPSTHDIVDIPAVREACFETVKKLLRYNNRVLITTKPVLSIVKTMDKLFSSFKENIQFRFTITSMDNSLLNFWEPNAPAFEERFKSLKYAFNRNYKTSVSIEPFLDRDPLKLVSKVLPFCTESIWLGKMNYISCQSNLSPGSATLYNDVRLNYSIDRLKYIFEKVKEIKRVRFKDSILIQLKNHGYLK